MPAEKHNWLSLPSPGMSILGKELHSSVSVISPTWVCLAWGKAGRRGRQETQSSDGTRERKVHDKPE